LGLGLSYAKFAGVVFSNLSINSKIVYFIFIDLLKIDKNSKIFLYDFIPFHTLISDNFHARKNPGHTRVLFHYNLASYIPQNNNYVVYSAYFQLVILNFNIL